MEAINNMATAKMSKAPTLRYSHLHECGQEIETIVTLNEFTMNLKHHPRKLDITQTLEKLKAALAEKTVSLDIHSMDFTHDYTGIEMRDKQIVCSKCGKDVLFPEKSTESEE